MSESTKLRRALVAELAEQIELSAPVREAFLAVPRERFLPRHAAEEGLEAVYRDAAIVTRTDASGAATSSSSQPTMMALMLEALRVEPGQRVLELGAGTGYNAALLAQLVGPAGHVVTVEIDEETAAEARAALEGSGVEVIAADGRDGWAAGAPYDRVVATVATAAVYPAWWRQLAPRGLLQAPLHIGDGLQPIVTFRRSGTELRSTDVRVGAFMTFRSTSGETLVEQPPGVSAGAIRIVGGGLGALDVAERAALAALVAGEPTERRALRGASFFALALYLSLTIPPERFVSLWPPFGAGLATADGIAFVVAPDRRRRARDAELRAYGSPAAEAELLEHVRAWEERGRPGERELQVTVDFVGEEEPLLTWDWR
jgi:protein-L-isoaspartate(D-aspartate) O-methyltransferase